MFNGMNALASMMQLGNRPERTGTPYGVGPLPQGQRESNNPFADLTESQIAGLMGKQPIPGQGQAQALGMSALNAPKAVAPQLAPQRQGTDKNANASMMGLMSMGQRNRGQTPYQNFIGLMG